MALTDSIQRPEDWDTRPGRVVRLRFFAGSKWLESEFRCGGRNAQSTSADNTAAAADLTFHGGRVVFEDVQVRKLRLD